MIFWHINRGVVKKVSKKKSLSTISNFGGDYTRYMHDNIVINQEVFHVFPVNFAPRAQTNF